MTLSPTQIRIATHLAAGLPIAQISSIINLSPSRISQLSSSEEFKAFLAEKMEEIQKKDIEEMAISAKYLSAEHLLLDQLVQMAPTAEFRDVTAAIRTIAERQDKAKLRVNPVHAGTIVHQHIVNLNLPAHAVPEIAISSTNEVLAINDTNLAPLSSDGVQNLFKSLKENSNDERRILEGSSRVITEASKTKEAVI